MTGIRLKFEVGELETPTNPAADQLFRQKSIECRLPGPKLSPAELKPGKHLAERPRTIADRAHSITFPRRITISV